MQRSNASHRDGRLAVRVSSGISWRGSRPLPHVRTLLVASPLAAGAGTLDRPGRAANVAWPAASPARSAASFRPAGLRAARHIASPAAHVWRGDWRAACAAPPGLSSPAHGGIGSRPSGHNAGARRPVVTVMSTHRRSFEGYEEMPLLCSSRRSRLTGSPFGLRRRRAVRARSCDRRGVRAFRRR